MKKELIVKALEDMKKQLKPLQDALDDDGLEVYSDDVVEVIEKLNRLKYNLTHEDETATKGA